MYIWTCSRYQNQWTNLKCKASLEDHNVFNPFAQFCLRIGRSSIGRYVFLLLVFFLLFLLGRKHHCGTHTHNSFHTMHALSKPIRGRLWCGPNAIYINNFSDRYCVFFFKRIFACMCTCWLLFYGGLLVQCTHTKTAYDQITIVSNQTSKQASKQANNQANKQSAPVLLHERTHTHTHTRTQANTYSLPFFSFTHRTLI